MSENGETVKVSIKRRYRILLWKVRQKIFPNDRIYLSRYIELDERIENTRDGVDSMRTAHASKILKHEARIMELERDLKELKHRLSWSEYYTHHDSRKS